MVCEFDLKQNLLGEIREHYPLLCNALRHGKGFIVMTSIKFDKIHWDILDITKLADHEFASYLSGIALVANYDVKSNKFSPSLHVKLNREYTYDYYKLCEDSRAGYRFLFRYITDNFTESNLENTLLDIMGKIDDIHHEDFLEFFVAIKRMLNDKQSIIGAKSYALEENIKKMFDNIEINYEDI